MIDGTLCYTLCPGLQPKWYEEKKEIRYNNIRMFDVPSKRFESKDCLLWHQPNNVFDRVGDPLYNVCSECKTEARRIVKHAERADQVDPQVKDARRNPSSNYPISSLSPSSKAIRMKRTKKELDVNKHKVSKYVQQSSELVAFLKQGAQTLILPMFIAKCVLIVMPRY